MPMLMLYHTLVTCILYRNGHSRHWVSVLIVLGSEVLKQVQEACTGEHLEEEKITIHKFCERILARSQERHYGSDIEPEKIAPKPRAPLENIHTGYPMEMVRFNFVGQLVETVEGNS